MTTDWELKKAADEILRKAKCKDTRPKKRRPPRVHPRRSTYVHQQWFLAAQELYEATQRGLQMEQPKESDSDE